MSLLVAIQSAIFYYVACTPCNEMKGRYKTKQQAKKDREEKMRIQMEQPGLYRHPSPFNTNPYWQEEINIGPRPPKKSNSKNTSQRGLNSAGTGRDSTSASLTCTSSNLENNSTVPTSPTLSPVEPASQLSGEGWNKHRYQREDEELWGHDLSKMGHRLVDNIVKAGNSAGRMIKGELGREKPITDEDRTNFYLTPKNPPVNDYHPPIVGSTPAHKGALQWMLQPPPSAKLMEGRVPVNRVQSFHSMASRTGQGRRTSRVSGASRNSRIGDDSRDHTLQEGLCEDQDPSESELIDALIGSSSRRTTLLSRGRSRRSRSFSLDSDKRSEPNTESELVGGHARSGSDDSDGIDGPAVLHSWDSLGRTRGSTKAARRPKLGTIPSSQSNAAAGALSSVATASNKSESTTPRPASPPSTKTSSPSRAPSGPSRDENTPLPVGS